MKFSDKIITDKGLALLNKVQAGAALEFTRAAVSDQTTLNLDTLQTMTALTHETHTFEIAAKEIRSATSIKIVIVISNQEMTDDTNVKEMGVFALDPDEGEILYCIVSAGNADNGIPAFDENLFEVEYSLLLPVGRSASVQLTIDETAIINIHKHDTSAHPDIRSLMDPDNNIQLAASIDKASKALFYNDVGTPNAVHLTRGATNEQVETLFDGMVVFFSPANQNTGGATLKVNDLAAKPMKFNDSALQAGMLLIGVKYIAVYQLSDDSFHIDVVASGHDITKTVVNDDGTIKDISGNKIAPSMDDFYLYDSGYGYQKLPSGLILQWGATGSNTNPVTLFPISFPVTPYVVIGNDYWSSGTFTVDSFDRSSFKLENALTGRYIAIGH